MRRQTTSGDGGYDDVDVRRRARSRGALAVGAAGMASVRDGWSCEAEQRRRCTVNGGRKSTNTTTTDLIVVDVVVVSICQWGALVADWSVRTRLHSVSNLAVVGASIMIGIVVAVDKRGIKVDFLVESRNGTVGDCCG